MRRESGAVPRWARAILFWRKVLMVERGGIPGSRGPAGGCKA